jgi:hypothetical protein
MAAQARQGISWVSFYYSTCLIHPQSMGTGYHGIKQIDYVEGKTELKFH